ncbi:MAG: ribonuclease III domain-containing protein [Lachnospiraceae bacterium]|nr:ribonuclease III domain-containing protein [Lachnospiraceae bacterium]
MDKSIISNMKEQLCLNDIDIRTYSPLAFAYIGDAVYELIIRTMLLNKGNMPVNKYHRKASHLVNASAQSEMIQELEPLLTEEEAAVFKRGRNAKSYTSAKHASVLEYRHATGFEALIGYLYLKEDMERIFYLIRKGLHIGEE